jgi:hypothetical protein
MALTLMISALSPLPEKFAYLPMGLMCSTNVPKHSTDVVVERPDAFQVDRLAVGASSISAANRSTFSHFALGSSSAEILGSTTMMPFEWSFKLDWDSMARVMASNNQVAQIRKPDISRLNAMFYTQHEAPLTITTTTESVVLRHLVSSIINGIDYSGIYRQLTIFPEQAVVACFRSLPAETTIVIRQRLRIAATKEQDSVVVEVLLQLEDRLCGSTMRADTEMSPMLDRLKTCTQNIALAIVRYASRASRSQDLVLKQVLDIVRTSNTSNIHRLRVVELVHVLVEAGAKLTHSCFFMYGTSAPELQRLIDLGGGDILTWIQDGLLMSAVDPNAKGRSQYSSSLVLDWILSSLKRSFNQKNVLDISTDNDALIAYPALVAAFNAALESSWSQAVEAIYDTCQQLGYAAYCTHVDSYVKSVVMLACINRDWATAVQAVPKIKAVATSQQFTFIQHDDKNRDELKKIFDEAMLAEDVQKVEELLDEGLEGWDWVENSIDSASDGIAALAAIYDAPDGILTLLRSRRVGAMSFLLCQYSH